MLTILLLAIQSELVKERNKSSSKKVQLSSDNNDVFGTSKAESSAKIEVYLEDLERDPVAV
jgi:hypothetical protein